MIKKIAICPHCKTKISCSGEQGEKKEVKCESCGKSGFVTFENLEEIDKYPVNEPYAFIKIFRDPDTLDKHYRVIGLRDVVDEMILYSASGAHTGACYDHDCPFYGVDCL